MRQLKMVWSLLAVCLALMVSTAVWAAPSAADKSFETARQFIKVHDDDQAVEELKHFLETFPTDSRFAQAAFLLGSSYQTLQKPDKALEAYTKVFPKALGNDPADVDLRARTHYQMASCYLMKQDNAKAEQYFNNYLQLSAKVDVSRDENLAKAWKGMIVNAQYRRAECLYQLGRKNEALQEYAKVLVTDQTDPYAAWACYMMGYIYLNQPDYEKAIANFERITKEYATSEVAGEASLGLGAAYLGRGRDSKDTAKRDSDYQKAIELLGNALKATNIPNSSKKQAAISLAEAYYEKGELTKSETMYTTALGYLRTDEPNSELTWQTQLQHAHVLYNMRKFVEARKEYAGIIETYATSKTIDKTKLRDVANDALFWSANCSYQLGTTTKRLDDYNSAVTVLDRFLKAAEKDDKAPQAALLLGYCYEDMADLGDKTASNKAVETYSMILKKWRDSDAALKAQSGIARQSHNMSPEALAALAPQLPLGDAAWDVMLQIAYKKYIANDYTGASEAAKKLLDGKPEPKVKAQAAYLVGTSLFKLQHPEQAVSYYQMVLTATPDGDLAPYARRALVQALLESKDFANAIKAATELIASPPQAKIEEEIAKERAERLMFQASAYYGNKQFDKAKESYLKLATDHPKSPLAPNALIYLAQIAERDDLKGAIAAYQKFVEAYPKHEYLPDVYLALGADLASLKQFEEAIAAYKNVPETGKLADQAAYAIALAYKGLKNDEAANKQFVLVTTKYQKSSYAVDSWYRVGEYTMAQKKYADAIRAFNESLKLAVELKIDTDAAQASLTYFNLASCAYLDGQFALAVETFGKVADTYPASDYASTSLFWKGQAGEKQGGDAAIKIARDAYQKYLLKSPTGEFAADAAVGVGRTAVASKQYKLARTDLQSALDILAGLEKGDNKSLAERAKVLPSEIQYLVGQSYYDEKDYKTANKEFAGVSLYKYEPWYSLSLLQIARCNAALGNKEKALESLKYLVNNLPKSDGAKQAPAVAKELGLEL